MGAALRVRLLGLWSLLVYVFLYAPLGVLAAFSFNRERLTATWRGFTFDWYLRLLDDTQVLSALRNSLAVALVATALATAIGTAAALAFHRHRFRRQAALDGLVMLPMVIPEIVMASSLLLLFAAFGLRLGFTSVVLAHVAFSVSYAVVVVRARLAGFDRSLEEAAMDLGAGPARTFFRVTLPGIAPGVLAAALLVFALSIDDYVVTSFVAGVGATTLPLQIYSMVRSGISPEINAVSTVLLAATGLLLLAAFLLEQGGARAKGGRTRARRPLHPRRAVRAGRAPRPGRPRAQRLHLVRLPAPGDGEGVRSPARRAGEGGPVRFGRGAAREDAGRQHGIRRDLPYELRGRDPARAEPAAPARAERPPAHRERRPRLPRPRLRSRPHPALALLPPAIRNSQAIFPPAEVVSRLELLRDIGPATVVYDRLWTEVKAAR